MSRSNSSPLLRLQSAEPAPSPTDDASKTSLHGGLMRGPRLLAPSARAALVAAAALLLAALACTWGAGGGGGGAPRYGPAAPTRLGRAAYGPGGRQELRRAPDSPMCRLDYSVKTWDGRLVPVCDVSKCAGRENVTALGRPAAFERRWSAEAEENFMVAFRAKKIGGWLHVRSRAAGWQAAAHAERGCGAAALLAAEGRAWIADCIEYTSFPAFFPVTPSAALMQPPHRRPKSSLLRQ